MSIKGLHQRFNRVATRLAPTIPFSNTYNLWKMLGDDGDTVLDVGCGNGQTMLSINRNRRFAKAVGVDIHPPYLERCRIDHTHDHLVRADVRRLPFGEKSVDTIVCMEVLEHLTKPDGIEFLRQLEWIARKRVVLSLPIGRWEQQPYDANPYQEHRSQWEPAEMRRFGYEVRVTGIRNTGGEWRGRQGIWQLIDIVWRLASLAVAPMVSLCPRFASNMVCGKELAGPSTSRPT